MKYNEEETFDDYDLNDSIDTNLDSDYSDSYDAESY